MSEKMKSVGEVAEQEYLTVPQMAREMGGAVSQDQIRALCRSGRIQGAVNKGAGSKAFYVVPRTSFNRFKTAGPEPRPAPPEKKDRQYTRRDKSEVNLLGL